MLIMDIQIMNITTNSTKPDRDAARRDQELLESRLKVTRQWPNTYNVFTRFHDWTPF